MIDNEQFAKLRREDLLQPAYGVKSLKETTDLYRNWGCSYDQQPERRQRYVGQ